MCSGVLILTSTFCIHSHRELVDADMKTNVDGVYAIGDIRNTDYKQVVVTTSDGFIAAMSIEKFLNNRKMVKVNWIHR